MRLLTIVGLLALSPLAHATGEDAPKPFHEQKTWTVKRGTNPDKPGTTIEVQRWNQPNGRTSVQRIAKGASGDISVRQTHRNADGTLMLEMREQQRGRVRVKSVVNNLAPQVHWVARTEPAPAALHGLTITTPGTEARPGGQVTVGPETEVTRTVYLAPGEAIPAEMKLPPKK